MKFVVRVQEGERVGDVCREMGISRKTGYKFLQRYAQLGPVGLYDVPPIAVTIRRMEQATQDAVLAVRKAHPSWGPQKIRRYLLAQTPGVKVPAGSTIGDLLKRSGLVKSRRRRRHVEASSSPPLADSEGPNALWCADYKGQFRLGNRCYCYPLTITDHHSRFILACEALEDTRGGPAKAVFEHVFRSFGMPERIRTDNGTPFASVGLHGLSKLSVWWMRLGIKHERIRPGCPQQNGRHERMHRTLKAETTRPPGLSLLQQQERFDHFVRVFNEQRPHEALAHRPPASAYERANRPFPAFLPEPEYAFDDLALRVTKHGHISLNGQRDAPRLYLATALAGELVGAREVADDEWRISFMHVTLGHWETRTNTFSTPSPQEATNSAPA
jgi:putative transposase